MYLHCANSKNQTTHKLSIRIHWQRVQWVGKLKKRTLDDYTIRRTQNRCFSEGNEIVIQPRELLLLIQKPNES